PLKPVIHTGAGANTDRTFRSLIGAAPLVTAARTHDGPTWSRRLAWVVALYRQWLTLPRHLPYSLCIPLPEAPMRALTLLLLIALPLAAQTPDQGGAVAVLRGVEFPEVNGQFTIARMTRYPMESAGASASYLSEGIRGEISVYVYPGEGPVTPETLEELFQLDIKATVEYARRAREATVESRPD